MTRDPFLRLALFALGCAIVLGLVLIAMWLGPAVIAVMAGGALLCAAVTFEQAPTRDELKEQLRPERPGHDEEGRPRGFRRIT